MSPDKLPEIAAQVAALLFAVSFHESAHAWVALRCGDTTARDLGRITLNPLKHMDPIGSFFVPAMLAFVGAPIIGWAKPVPISLRGVPKPRRANLLISAAGPASNLVLAVLFAIVVLAIHPFVPAGSKTSPQYAIFVVALYSVLVNVALALFNLVPVPPLDGFGVVESLAPAAAIPAMIWLRRYGFVVLIALLYFGVIGRILRPAQEFVVQLLFGGLS